jgi:hypothetical protein
MLKEYFAALFHGWVGKMSGLASVILTFLPILLPKLFSDSAWVIRAIWIAAAICFVIANHSAWKFERDKYEAEAEKNTRPEIRGAAFNFGIASGTVHDWTTPPRASFPVAFEMNVCNHRDVTTNIVDIGLDGSKLSPPVEFSEVHSPLVGRTLKFGIGVTSMPIYAIAHVNGMVRADVPPIKMANLLVYVQDGFMGRHVIPVINDEEIRSQ